MGKTLGEPGCPPDGAMVEEPLVTGTGSRGQDLGNEAVGPDQKPQSTDDNMLVNGDDDRLNCDNDGWMMTVCC